MAEREGPRRVTQHQLELSAPEEDAPAPEIEPGPSARSGTTDAPVSREPSDVRLRERRHRWLEERERFERSQGSGSTSSSSK